MHKNLPSIQANSLKKLENTKAWDQILSAIEKHNNNADGIGWGIFSEIHEYFQHVCDHLNNDTNQDGSYESLEHTAVYPDDFINDLTALFKSIVRKMRPLKYYEANALIDAALSLNDYEKVNNIQEEWKNDQGYQSDYYANRIKYFSETGSPQQILELYDSLSKKEYTSVFYEAVIKAFGQFGFYEKTKEVFEHAIKIRNINLFKLYTAYLRVSSKNGWFKEFKTIRSLMIASQTSNKDKANAIKEITNGLVELGFIEQARELIIESIQNTSEQNRQSILAPQEKSIRNIMHTMITENKPYEEIEQFFLTAGIKGFHTFHAINYAQTKHHIRLSDSQTKEKLQLTDEELIQLNEIKKQNQKKNTNKQEEQQATNQISGAFKNAINIFTDMSADTKKRGQHYTSLFHCVSDADEFEQAYPFMSEAVENGVDTLPLYIQFILAAHRAGRFKKAKEVFNQAIEKKYLSSILIISYIRFCTDRGNFNQLAKAIEIAIQHELISRDLCETTLTALKSFSHINGALELSQIMKELGNNAKIELPRTLLEERNENSFSMLCDQLMKKEKTIFIKNKTKIISRLLEIRSQKKQSIDPEFLLELIKTECDLLQRFVPILLNIHQGNITLSFIQYWYITLYMKTRNKNWRPPALENKDIMRSLVHLPNAIGCTSIIDGEVLTETFKILTKKEFKFESLGILFTQKDEVFDEDQIAAACIKDLCISGEYKNYFDNNFQDIVSKNLLMAIHFTLILDEKSPNFRSKSQLLLKKLTENNTAKKTTSEAHDEFLIRVSNSLSSNALNLAKYLNSTKKPLSSESALNHIFCAFFKLKEANIPSDATIDCICIFSDKIIAPVFSKMSLLEIQQKLKELPKIIGNKVNNNAEIQKQIFYAWKKSEKSENRVSIGLQILDEFFQSTKKNHLTDQAQELYIEIVRSLDSNNANYIDNVQRLSIYEKLVSTKKQKKLLVHQNTIFQRFITQEKIDLACSFLFELPIQPTIEQCQELLNSNIDASNVTKVLSCLKDKKTLASLKLYCETINSKIENLTPDTLENTLCLLFDFYNEADSKDKSQNQNEYQDIAIILVESFKKISAQLKPTDTNQLKLMRLAFEKRSFKKSSSANKNISFLKLLHQLSLPREICKLIAFSGDHFLNLILDLPYLTLSNLIQTWFDFFNLIDFELPNSITLNNTIEVILKKKGLSALEKNFFFDIGVRLAHEYLYAPIHENYWIALIKYCKNLENECEKFTSKAISFIATNIENGDYFVFYTHIMKLTLETSNFHHAYLVYALQRNKRNLEECKAKKPQEVGETELINNELESLARNALKRHTRIVKESDYSKVLGLIILLVEICLNKKSDMLSFQNYKDCLINILNLLAENKVKNLNLYFQIVGARLTYLLHKDPDHRNLITESQWENVWNTQLSLLKDNEQYMLLLNLALYTHEKGVFYHSQKPSHRHIYQNILSTLDHQRLVDNKNLWDLSTYFATDAVPLILLEQVFLAKNKENLIGNYNIGMLDDLRAKVAQDNSRSHAISENKKTAQTNKQPKKISSLVMAFSQFNHKPKNEAAKTEESQESYETMKP